MPNTEASNSLSVFGQIVREQIEKIPDRFPNITVDKYVIMPNHIHLLLMVSNEADQAARKSICEAICAFKSIAAKQCRKIDPELKVFQTSFHDHIVRNESDYQQIWNYIDTNILRWANDCFYI